MFSIKVTAKNVPTRVSIWFGKRLLQGSAARVTINVALQGFTIGIAVGFPVQVAMGGLRSRPQGFTGTCRKES